MPGFEFEPKSRVEQPQPHMCANIRPTDSAHWVDFLKSFDYDSPEETHNFRASTEVLHHLKKPWNDSIPVNTPTNVVASTMVSKWCNQILSIRSMFGHAKSRSDSACEEALFIQLEL